MSHPRLRRLARRLAATALAGALVLGGIVLRSRDEVRHTRLETVQLSSPKVTGRPLRIVQVSDVHNMPDATQRSEVVALVAAQHPDLIAITGDLESYFTTSLTELDDFVARLARLGVPLYFVPGNHENDNRNPGATVLDVAAMLQRHGVQVLLNRHVAQDGPWGQLDVVGTDDYYTHRGDLPTALRGSRPGAYRLVLTHSPQVFDALAASDADLAICGHTHGGQVRVPGIGALYTPGGGFLPRLDKGLFPAGRAQLYIDSGAGQSFPLRLNDRSQVSLLVVQPAAAR